MEAEYITIHESQCVAKDKATWMVNNNKNLSMHDYVDEDDAINCIPHNRNVFACGDGTQGKGNRTSINVEICYSYDYDKAVKNTVNHVADLLFDRGWNTQRLRRHKDWSGRKDPKKLDWEKFLQDVAERLDILNGKDINIAPVEIKFEPYEALTMPESSIYMYNNHESEIIGRTDGSRVKIIKEDCGYGYVENKGWINLKDVKKPKKVKKEQTSFKPYSVKARDMVVREEPNQDSNVVRRVLKGSRIEVFETVKNGDYTYGKLQDGYWVAIKRKNYYYVKLIK